MKKTLPALLFICLLFLSSCAEKEMIAPYEGIAHPRTAVNITTSIGTMRIVLFDEEMPLTTENFRNLVDRRFYHGLTFHRIVRNELIQGGDPNGDGSGGSGDYLKFETDPALTNIPYSVGMAHPANEKDKASSQFYILMTEHPELDGSYAVFGHVVKGQDMIKSLHYGDVMVSLEAGPANEEDWELLQKDIEKWRKDREAKAFNERNMK